MRPYLAIVDARFRMLLQYRAAALAGIVTQVFWGLIRVMIFEAFYLSSKSPQPLDLKDVITYVWLSQAFLGMLPWNADAEIRQMIRSGTVAYELLRPVDLYNFWYSRAMATRTAPTFMRAMVVLPLASIFFGMQMPPSVPSAAAWLASMIGALLLGCAISTILNITIMWTISADGVSRIIPAVVTIFSGMIIPLPLFPDWARPILDLLPFAGLVDKPNRLFVGDIPPEGIWGVLALQLGWTLILVLIGKLMLAKGTKILVVQGG
jgi:ABC-2 type transport system permease protein